MFTIGSADPWYPHHRIELMVPDDTDAVLSSYRRCMSSEQFADSFYILFLASSEEVSEKFQFTDFVR